MDFFTCTRNYCEKVMYRVHWFTSAFPQLFSFLCDSYLSMRQWSLPSHLGNGALHSPLDVQVTSLSPLMLIPSWAHVKWTVSPYLTGSPLAGFPLLMVTLESVSPNSQVRTERLQQTSKQLESSWKNLITAISQDRTYMHCTGLYSVQACALFRLLQCSGWLVYSFIYSN